MVGKVIRIGVSVRRTMDVGVGVGIVLVWGSVVTVSASMATVMMFMC